ncbi:hypothetical protein KUTeg_020759 [Tegillarca granosa]|uniref:Uncharacterized protein n=1 Tax=Tegillarca granosa TaxID=220873 RepID=A0ABQ9ED19_TEGGR|nr:hypothetical protein KUTeg_020759 [Tegillarca granosa]
MSKMDAAKKEGLPKLRDLLRRRREDSLTESMGEIPDIEFYYEDADTYKSEMAELYSYTEESEFTENKACFEESYCSTGVFGECSTDEEQLDWSYTNVHMIYEQGLFPSFVELLAIEIENNIAASEAISKTSVSIADSKDLRLITNVLYTVVETMRVPKEMETEQQKRNRELFKEDLVQPCVGEDSLPITLFIMVTKFCSGHAPHFPMKKVSLGGLRELQDRKNKVREENGLPPLPEDTYEVFKTMRASSPPASAADLIEQQIPRRSFRGGKRSLIKQSSLEADPFDTNSFGEDDFLKDNDNGKTGSDDELPPTPPRPATPTVPQQKTLPWKPKVRQKELDLFLEHTRSKFVGFQVKNDQESLAGLPQPIHEGVKVLKQHLYISLTEIQIKREEEIAKNPLSKAEQELISSPVESLYQALLPNLPQYMIALLKILLAAAPTSKTKTDSINILSDVLPEQMPYKTIHRHTCTFQFEFMSQHLVFANCIPLVLKFFNQNTLSYVGAKNSIPVLDYPSCVIGEQEELTAEALENGDAQPYCWRNLFSCINLLRILNKLTKWKHSRTMVNMDARPWDFQAEECALRACVDRFNNRRYGTNGADPEFKPVDNNIVSVLGEPIELSEEFKHNYEKWLYMEVYSHQIDWDQIICH